MSTWINPLNFSTSVTNGVAATGPISIANGGTGQTTADTSFNALAPTTSEGDLIYYNSSNNKRLAIGTNGQVLTSNGTDPVWSAPATSGTVTSVDMSVPSVLSISGNPVTSSGTLSIGYSGTALPIANGGTNVTSVTTTPTASSWAGWGPNMNMRANGFISGQTSTATSGSTVSLLVSSTEQQIFTGTSTQLITLPDVTTLMLGQEFVIINNTSPVATLTIQSYGANTITTQTSSNGTYICQSITDNSASGWIASLALNDTQVWPISRGGTGVSTVTTTPTASAWVGWDANKNLNANNFVYSYANLTGNTTYSTFASIPGFMDCAGTFTITLPTTGLIVGPIFFLQNRGGTTITITGNSSVSFTTVHTAWLWAITSTTWRMSQWSATFNGL